MIIRIDSIVPAKWDCVCRRCKKWILKGELKLVEKARSGYGDIDKNYCIKCGPQIMDNLDAMRIIKQAEKIAMEKLINQLNEDEWESQT